MKTFILTVTTCFFTIINAFTQTVTYKDVQPIFLNKCVSCHRPGDAAPFSLITYDDVAKRVTFIKDVIEKNYMPPWKADVHYRDFANNRSLTKIEKNTLLIWIKNKAPKGDFIEAANDGKLSLIKETVYNRAPDATLKMTTPFLVKGDNAEKFLIFKIPFDFATANNIEAVEFITNNKKIVHHINYGFFNVADSDVDINGGHQYINSLEDTSKQDPYLEVKKNPVYYTGWIPGTGVESYPKDFGWVLPKRGVMLLTVHYSAAAIDAESILGVNLFFTKNAIKREVKIISFGSGGIGEEDITPRLLIYPNKVSTFDLVLKTQEDQSVMYLWPHMHFIGKEFTAYAVTPSKDTIKLVHIPDWDFRWQELYKMKQMLKIPKGSILHMTGSYDNTAANPNNPNNPPKFVYSTGDMRSLDEMFTMLMIYVPYEVGDEKVAL